MGLAIELLVVLGLADHRPPTTAAADRGRTAAAAAAASVAADDERNKLPPNTASGDRAEGAARAVRRWSAAAVAAEVEGAQQDRKRTGERDDRSGPTMGGGCSCRIEASASQDQ